MNLRLILETGPAIQIHLVAAVLASVLGGLTLFRRKGDRLHRLGGFIWVALMVVVAASSFFIHEIRTFGPWSPIHLLSIITLVGLYRGVNHARMKRITAHRRTMQGLYVGALGIAGLFTFAPGRLMNGVFFGGPSPATGAAVAVLIAALAIGITFLRLRALSRTART